MHTLEDCDSPVFAPVRDEFAKHALLLVASAVGFGLLAYFSVSLTRDETRIAALWAPNAVMIALMIRLDGRYWLGMLVAALAGNIVANLTGGDSVLRAMGLSLANFIESVIVLLLLAKLRVTCPDFADLRHIARFVLTVVLSSTASGIVACLILPTDTATQALALWWNWTRADGLGLLLFVPAITIIIDAVEHRRALTRPQVIEAALIICGGTAVSIFTFWQTKYPFLFLDAPVVLVYAMRLGSLGNAVAIINLAIVATVATSLGHGPINLVQGGTSEKLMVLQVFLASSFAIGLPFAALLQTLKNSREGYRQAAEQLAEANRVFDTLASMSPAGIFRADVAGNCTFANARCLEFIGITMEQARNNQFSRYMHDEDRQRLLDRWQREVANGNGFEEEFRIVVPGRQERWLNTQVSTEKDAFGNVTGFIGVQVDVTRRKAAEQELRSAKDDAEEAMNAKANFLANMSHEIRTPMNGVLGFADLLLASELDERQRRHAELIVESGRSMVALIDDILDLSKIEADAMRISHASINLQRTLGHAVRLMRAAASKKGLELMLHYPDDVPRAMRGDKLRIGQIVNNLLGNAIKFSNAGTIDVVVTRSRMEDTDTIEIHVTDQGIGIAPDKLDLVFEQFAQANKEVASHFGGSGLGLAISRRLARLMGGDITVRSTPGAGSTFTLVLPFEASEEQIDIRFDPAEVIPPDAPSQGQKGKVLIAEDNAINQELISELVSSLGYAFDLAENGREAVDLVLARSAQTPYQLVLMDMQMPQMDGISAARKIREAGYSAERLPIVALTANAFEDDVAACLGAGMQAHLAKPINSAALAAALAKWHPASARLEKREQHAGDSTIARYRGKFDTLKSETVSLARAWLDAHERGCQQAGDDLANKLHQISGTAELFAEKQVGDLARQGEALLKGKTPGATAERIAGELRQFIRLAT